MAPRQIGNRAVAANAWVKLIPLSGTASTVSSLTISSTAGLATNGNNLTVNIPLSFFAAFSGAKNTYGLAIDNASQSSPWVNTGTWNVVGPAVVSGDLHALWLDYGQRPAQVVYYAALVEVLGPDSGARLALAAAAAVLECTCLYALLRLHTAQENTHVLYRHKLNRNNGITFDAVFKSGRIDSGKFIHTAGIGAYYDRPKWFWKLYFDPHVNFTDHRMVRTGIGFKF